jgi:hypothetical protein
MDLMNSLPNATSPQYFIALEAELLALAEQTHTSPYIIYNKVVSILSKYGIRADTQDLTLTFDDFEDTAYFFKLDYPEEIANGVLYLTFEFFRTEDEFFIVDINIMSEEELDDFIGEDEVEEI